MKRIGIITLMLFSLKLMFAQIPTTGLVAHYPLNGNAGDSSGNGYHGTVHGAQLTTDRFGKINSAYKFNGTNNYISITENVGFSQFGDPQSTYTLCSWVKSENGSGVILSDISIDGWFYLSYSGNILGAGIRTADWGGQGVSHEVSNNNWHFIAAMFESPKLKLYIDGKIVDSTTLSTGILVADMPGGGVKIGLAFAPDNQYFNGSVDDVRVYDRALDTTELKALYEEYSNTVIQSNDTIEIKVSDKKIENISPIVINKEDTVTLQNGIKYVINKNYRLVYQANYYSDTIHVNDTTHIVIKDTIHIGIKDTIHIGIKDTTHIIVKDTVHITVKDTIHITIKDTVQITVEDTLNILIHPTTGNSSIVISQIKVYPNPAREVLNIAFENYQNLSGYKLKIFNNSGQAVWNSNITEELYQIDLGQFGEAGIYYIQIIDGSNVLNTQKVIHLKY